MAVKERNYEGSPAESTPPQSLFRRALEDYKDALQTAWRHDEAGQRLREVWQAESVRPPQTPPPDYATQLEQAASFARRAQEAWLPKETTDQFNAAFSTYLNKVRDAWTKLDAESTHPADLMAIANTLAEAASLLAVPLPRKRA